MGFHIAKFTISERWTGTSRPKQRPPTKLPSAVFHLTPQANVLTISSRWNRPLNLFSAVRHHSISPCQSITSTERDPELRQVGPAGFSGQGGWVAKKWLSRGQKITITLMSTRSAQYWAYKATHFWWGRQHREFTFHDFGRTKFLDQQQVAAWRPFMHPSDRTTHTYFKKATFKLTAHPSDVLQSVSVPVATGGRGHIAHVQCYRDFYACHYIVWDASDELWRRCDGDSVLSWRNELDSFVYSWIEPEKIETQEMPNKAVAAVRLPAVVLH